MINQSISDHNHQGKEALIYVIDDVHVKEKQNESELELTQSLNSAVLGLKEDKLSNGDIVRYAAILDKLQISDYYQKDEILKFKKLLTDTGRSNVFARSDFDIGKVTKFKPFHILIKDESKLSTKIKKMNLNPIDRQILDQEVKYYIEGDLCEWQTNDNPKTVAKHISSTFIVHRDLGNDDDGNKITKSRAVNDYVTLNDNTYDYLHKNPTCDDIHDQISGARIYCSTDIKKYFYHIPMNDDHRPLACIAVPDGILSPKRMMQGLKNAPVYGNMVSTEAYKGVAIAMQDDLHQGFDNPDFRECLNDAKKGLIAIIDRSLLHDIKLHASKTVLGYKDLISLGRMVSSNGLAVTKKLCAKALEMQWDNFNTMTDYKAHIGLLQFARDHIHNLAEDLFLLNAEMIQPSKLPPKIDENGRELSKAQQNGRHYLCKSDEAKKIFDRINAKLTNTPILHPADLKLSSKHMFLLKVDTSLHQTGGSLWQQNPRKPAFVPSADPKIFEQELNEKYVLIKVFSKLLAPTQTRYGATVRECFGCKHWMIRNKKYLQRGNFILICDCKPLLSLFNLHNDSVNRTMLRWRNELQLFTFVLKHREGIKMPLEDWMSRYAHPTEDTIDEFTDSKEELCAIESFRDCIMSQIIDTKSISAIELSSKTISKTENISFPKKKEDQDIEYMDTSATNSSNSIYSILCSVNQMDSIVDESYFGQMMITKNVFKRLKHLSSKQSLITADINYLRHSETMKDIKLKQIEPIMTRSRTESDDLRKVSAQKQLDGILKDYNKRYLLNPSKLNILLSSNEQPLDLIKNEQLNVYGNIMMKLRNPSYQLAPKTVMDIVYHKLYNSGKLSLRDDDALMYMKSRMVIPPKLRMVVLQHCHIEGTQHKGTSYTFEYMRKYYYWPNMIDDIKYVLERCPCKAAKVNNKLEYYKDKGLMSPYIAKKQNEFLFMDLYGPLWDNHFILVMYDIFDGYMLLERTANTALAIIKVIIFRWIMMFGFIKKLGNDCGSYFTSLLNKTCRFIMGIPDGDLNTYSPWTNPSESKMRSLCNSLKANKIAYDRFEVKQVYDKLDKISQSSKHVEYENYLPSIQFAHNNAVKQSTGFSPNSLRLFAPIYTSILEMNLRLKSLPQIEASKYMEKGDKVNMAAFSKLIRQNHQLLLNKAYRRKIKYNQQRQRYYNSLKSIPILKNDYVIWKPIDKPKGMNKYTTNEKFGYYVVKVLVPDKKYLIKNIFDAKEPAIPVLKGHIRLSHKPLWKNENDALDSSNLRIDICSKYANEQQEKQRKFK